MNWSRLCEATCEQLGDMEDAEKNLVEGVAQALVELAQYKIEQGLCKRGVEGVTLSKDAVRDAVAAQFAAPLGAMVRVLMLVGATSADVVERLVEGDR